MLNRTKAAVKDQAARMQSIANFAWPPVSTQAQVTSRAQELRHPSTSRLWKCPYNNWNEPAQPGGEHK